MASAKRSNNPFASRLSRGIVFRPRIQGWRLGGRWDTPAGPPARGARLSVDTLRIVLRHFLNHPAPEDEVFGELVQKVGKLDVALA